MNAKTETVVTIGFCIRNEEATIRKAIESVAHQDFPHTQMELVFVDDGSTDKTLEIINSMLTRIDIGSKIFHTEWRGIGPARQTAVENASGKFILFVDGHETLTENYLSKQVEVMQNFSCVAISAGLLGICCEESWVATLENINYVVVRLEQKGRLTSLLPGTGGAIMRLEALRQVGGFNRDLKRSGEDLDLAFRLKQAGWLFNVGNAVYYHEFRRTWKALWQQHFMYGYWIRIVMNKNKRHHPFRYKAVDHKILLSSLAYKLTHRRVVFLLPLNYFLKRTALLFGFVKAYLEGIGHRR